MKAMVQQDTGKKSVLCLWPQHGEVVLCQVTTACFDDNEVFVRGVCEGEVQWWGENDDDDEGSGPRLKLPLLSIRQVFKGGESQGRSLCDTSLHRPHNTAHVIQCRHQSSSFTDGLESASERITSR
ncbi:hypothetical protein E2C01_034088 [Portunus trituberculatus]|uniref:Uncharacterized protein n=1 Tax=Portunus trituberculatus TaxID=210409 RepID=A0A5B7F5X7_PORTR|nr:hypothetical protein [Portunus trituberculatus]